MRCYICNKETNNFRKDPDGKYVSICPTCRGIINDYNRRYLDADEDDIKLLKMTGLDFIKSMEKEDAGRNKGTTEERNDS